MSNVLLLGRPESSIGLSRTSIVNAQAFRVGVFKNKGIAITVNYMDDSCHF